VEIHTGMYANAKKKRQKEELVRVMKAAEHALKVGIMVNAGHGLNYLNVSQVAAISGLRGLYIGHSIVSRALLIGMEYAVKEMKNLIKESSRRV
jgi:pyridoxine 5-phosphate synthase